MQHRWTALLLLFVFCGAGCGTGNGSSPTPVNPAPQAVIDAQAERLVYLCRGLSAEELIAVTANVAAANPSAVVLVDEPASRADLEAFLRVYQPQRVVPVGSGFGPEATDLEKRLSVKVAPVVEWKLEMPAGFWKNATPLTGRAVVCPSAPRGQLLQAACLAGGAQAPLVVLRGVSGEGDEVRRHLAAWKVREVWAVGDAGDLFRGHNDWRVVKLANEEAVAAAHLQQQQARGALATLVVANPADTGNRLGGMSTLAPWITLQRQAALLLTNEKGGQVGELVQTALKKPELTQADNLILVGSLQALPMEQRPNPLAGKDVVIEMEPLTPAEGEPFSFATGRLFHEDLGTVSLMVARQHLLGETRTPRKALVISNPVGGLPLLELFSRDTVLELRNRGYQTTARFRKEAHKDEVRRLLPEQDIFLWEGHHQTLVERYQLPSWTEPLRPSLVFLQSCLALNEKEAQPLLRRGAVGVVGASTRTYSGTGGAFTLAYFDALLYDDQSLGGALRQAKNFLLAYTMLKERRLHDRAQFSGANLRSAWAFTLWGDPTLKLPQPPIPPDALPPVRYQVQGQTLTVLLPQEKYPLVSSGAFQAQTWPNARLAGLLSGEKGEAPQRLLNLLFSEITLSQTPPGQVPRLRTSLPANDWVFCWDSRRRSGYLLIAPPRDAKELRFQIEWEAAR